MKKPTESRKAFMKILSILTTVVLLAGLLSACGTAQPSFKDLDDWHISMAQMPLPKTGCFKSTYPSKDWQEDTCTTAPPYPLLPRRGPRPQTAGNGNDISTQAATGSISTAIGSFDSVTGVTSECSQINGTGSCIANAYTLQINTEFFTSTACSGAAVPANCQGWEQFVYENDGSNGWAFIQYWLIQYDTTCPAGVGWISYPYPGPTNISCYRNSTNSSAVPNQAITNLGQLSLSGAANAGSDSYTFSTGSTVYSANGDNSVNAAGSWTIAEFNVIGDAGGAQAVFNSGSAVVPKTRILSGSTAAPTCLVTGFTGETNNLNFGPAAPASVSTPGPALAFTESTAGVPAANCSYARTIGDTHLHTVLGLFYDFQATGDFILAQVDPDFVVQTRQVSGAPTWPDASVNNAVATRMGKTQAALCLGEAPLHIDGAPTKLDDGKSLSLPDGVDIWRTGNVYVIMDQSGNSVRAEINATWINVSVGLGRWPVEVRGLLANHNGNVNEIEASDGTVLTTPFSYDDLYGHFADSWRVPADESLLSVCTKKGEAIEPGIPKKLFFAQDLDPEIYKRTRAICEEAGVKGDALLDACTLDVAVIGKDAAAKVFVDVVAPIAVGVKK